jgi:DNA-binding beta-propeller fold protein YncE
MKAKTRVLGLALLLFGTALPARPAAQGATPSMPSGPMRAFVLDAPMRRITAIDTATAKVTATVDLADTPEALDYTADRATLVVFSNDRGKPTKQGYRPSAKSTLTLIDSSTMKIRSHLELGWNLGRYAMSNDGRRLWIACGGYDSGKPAELLPRELVTVDLTEGTVAARLPLSRRVARFGVDQEHNLGLLFSTDDTVKKGPALPAQLVFVDLSTGSALSTLGLDGDPVRMVMAPDGLHAYVFETGSPSNKPEKNINGRVQVINLQTRSVETNLDAGSNPRGLVVDDDAKTALILSDAPPSAESKNRAGELRIIRGAAIAATLPVGANPLFLKGSPNREHLYVVSAAQLTDIDYPSLKVIADMPLESAGASGAVMSSWLFDSKHHVSALAFRPDGTRAFAIYDQSSKLSVLDLTSHKLIGSVTTGRKSVKVGKFLGALGATMLSGAVAGNLASASGASFYSYPIFDVGRAQSSVVVGADGHTAYALNRQTNDVTLVSADGQVIKTIAAGGNTLEFLAGNQVLAVEGSNSLKLIDVSTAEPLPEPDFGGHLNVFTVSPDGRTAVILADKTVLLLNGATGTPVARLDGFVKPTAIIFLRLP